MRIDRVTGPLTVGQLAALAGVRADTIRYYERSGLLPEPNRTDGDHRRYGPADLDRMLFIRGAQRLGLRLAEIRELPAGRATRGCPFRPAGSAPGSRGSAPSFRGWSPACPARRDRARTPFREPGARPIASRPNRAREE